MASGDIVGIITAIMGPATAMATPSAIAGASTPAENVPVWDFDKGTDESLDLYCVLGPGYAGGGLTIRLPWTAAVIANEATIGVAIRRIADDADDLDSTAHTYDFNFADVTAPSAAGEVVYDNITFTDGADMDSVAAGEMFIMRITRDANHANDDLDADFRLLATAIQIRET
jgi:hypothetical protein